MNAAAVVPFRKSAHPWGTIGVGRSATDNRPEMVELDSFDDFQHFVLRDEGRGTEAGRYVCAAMGGNGTRNTSNALAQSYIQLDGDNLGGEKNARDLLAYIEAQGWRCFAYHTKSSTPQNPRLRIFLAASGPIQPRAVRAVFEAMRARLLAALPALPADAFDAASGRPAQIWYLPTQGAPSEIFEGAPVDVRELLAAGTAPTPSQQGAPSIPAYGDGDGDDAGARLGQLPLPPLAGVTIEDVHELLKRVSPKDRADWLKVGLMLHHQFGQDGFELWCEWSSGELHWKLAVLDGIDGIDRGGSLGWLDFHECADDGAATYGLEANEKTWAGFCADRAGGVTIRSLYRLAGVEGPREVADGDTGAAMSEDACALEWSQRYPDWRYTPAFGRWDQYDDSAAVWRPDYRLLHFTTVRELVRGLMPGRKHTASAVAGVASLTRSNPGVSMGADQWDADPRMLGTPGAIIDLRTGGAVADPRCRYVTRQTAVSAAPPGASTPIWDAFLRRITQHDPELIGYLQRIAGYALTGSDREQCLFVAYGPGGNGKGVFMNTLTNIIGEYAHVASGDLLLAASGDRHPTDMASLRGRRFVTASELRPGARWDEQRLKSLTGGDPITARFMRQDEFTFRPQFTLVLSTNHRPSFTGVDEAIRRRVRLIPFAQVIPADERDPDLPEKLRGEWPGILRWMIDGCLAWQRDGLATPASVVEASAAYLEAEDSLGQWITDRIQRHLPNAAKRAFTPRKTLFDDWHSWTHANGGPSWSAKAFYLALEERGFLAGVREGVRGFRDVVLTTSELGPWAP